MTSTAVRDVGSVLTNLGVGQAGKNAGSPGEFQKVWSNQMSRNTMGSYVPDSAAQDSTASAGASANTAKPQDSDENAGGKVPQKGQAVQDDSRTTSEPSEEVKVPEEDTETKGGLPAASGSPDQPAEELTPEELEQAMEILNTAAAGLMQQIADVFGISMEDLQAAMDALGMGQTDLLNADALGGLLLKLGGAEDSYALLMDETLYGNYRTLMEQLENVVEESAGVLEMDSGQMESLLQKISVSTATAEEAHDATPDAVPGQEEEGRMADVAQGTPVRAVAETMDGKQGISGEQAEGQTGQHREEGKRSAERADAEPTQQVFGQNLRTEQFQPQVEQAEGIVQNSGWTADTRNIMNQIMDYMKLQLNVDSTSMEMQLHPASLGTLRVQIDSSAGVLTAHFITQNESVKAALESQMVQLQESFEEQGIKVEAIEVTVQTHEFEQNLEQGRDRNQQAPDKRNRTRRIQLNDPLAMEAMEEEDTLTARMMAENGNTVDYTA